MVCISYLVTDYAYIPDIFGLASDFPYLLKKLQLIVCLVAEQYGQSIQAPNLKYTFNILLTQ